MQVSCTRSDHFKGNKRYIDTFTFLKKEDEEHVVVLKQIQCFGQRYNFFFRLVMRLKHGSSYRG